MTRSLRRTSASRRRRLTGLLFVSPWIVGVLAFFLVPMGQSVFYMFNDVTVEPGGMKSVYVGGEILQDVLLDDPQNVRMMLTSIAQTLGEVLLIVAFSLFIAIILSQEFRGRTVARAIFALPIIVSSGVLLAVFKQDLFASSMAQTSDVTIFQSAALEMSMLKLGLDPSLVSQLTGAVSSILDLLWKCGVQILLFIGGIKAVPAHLYEVCSVEGANAWQTFWKVTFPLVTPFILLNAVYSIIDSFTDYGNTVMKSITDYFHEGMYAYSNTIALIYFVTILLVVGLVHLIVSRFVFYSTD